MKGIRDGWLAALEGHIGADGVGATGSPAAHLVKGRWIAEQVHIESSWVVEEWKSAELGRRENVRERTRYRNRNGEGSRRRTYERPTDVVGRAVFTAWK